MTVAAGRRTGLAILVVSALVGTLLAASAGPAAGVGDKKVTYPARYSACVGDATKDAGFEDTVGGIAELAVDCLSYYGITQGKRPGVFSPADDVTRVQMALFLSRAAGPAGIVLPPPRDQGFTDIADLPVHFRDAINRMAELGIMEEHVAESETTEGDPGKRFAPSDPVIRQDMAAHLAAFLAAAEVGPGGYDIDKVKPDDDVFTDIEDVLHYAYESVRKIYEMGITQGTSPTTFSPQGTVTRAQMAAFITRMLAHTNARPAGPSIQLDLRRVYTGGPMGVAISMRSPTFRPLSDSYVDVFTAGSRTSAINKDGRCTANVTRRQGVNACVIDAGDRMADRLGNVTFNEYPGGKPLVMWAWTGGLEEFFDSDRTEAAVIDIGEVEGAAAFEVTDNMATNARILHFGDPVVLTFQLVDRKGDHIPHAGVEMRLYTRRTDSKGKRTSSSRIEATDQAGRVQVTFREKDPSSGTRETISLDVDARASLPFDDKTTVLVVQNDSAGLSSDAQLIWSDEEARATTLRLEQDQAYHEASDAGDGAQNTVRATLVDQYGDPITRERISFNSDDPLGLPNLKQRPTNSEGVASLSYLRDSADPGLERIWAITVSGRARRAPDLFHYWAKKPAAGQAAAGTVAVADTAANVIVVHKRGVNPPEIWFLEYTTADHLFVVRQSKANEDDSSDPKPIAFEDFEATIEKGDRMAFQMATATNIVDTFTLTEIVDVPDAPGAPSVSVTSGSATISWNRPRDDGGAPIDRYQLRWRCDSNDDWTETSGLLASNLQATGLKHTVSHSCTPVYVEAQVRALNEINDDWGEWSNTGSGSG